VLAGGRGLLGHVFNLGHGVLPDTDPGLITFAVEAVHRHGLPFEGRG
jgi:uroporphyrinogen decarboxylase